ncbi:glycosyltransferase [uncultured Sulfitobacter sp.]|uniref:glycosyltransferase n=1 Tax=uncultured Sulfitobacter sp. TaxID=191468 RepID=UPI0026298D6C|nr:glycosyltransferase [uncultured Sulfitobacter sp.]
MTGSSAPDFATRALGAARRRASRLKHSLLKTSTGTGTFHGHVEGIAEDGTLRGWVYTRATRKGRVQVAICAGDTVLEAGFADRNRRDVAAAHGCEAECGFLFALSDTMFAAIQKAGGTVVVRTMGAQEQTLGEVEMQVDTTNPEPHKGDIRACRFALREYLDDLDALLEETPDAPLPKIVQPAFEKHHRMFTKDKVIPDLPVSGHPAYLDYVRYRYRMDEQYKVGPGLESADRYLYWYLTSYRGQEKRRVPLSAENIEYLNTPMVMGGQQFSLTRMMWWRLTGRADMLGNINLNDRDSYLDVLFWWAHQDSTHMFFEDCLVPDRYADFLRGVHPSRRLDAWPLSYFTERFFQDTPRLHFLKPGTAEGRKTLVLAMLVIAARRPDVLRYIPRNQIAKLLAPATDGGPSEFEDFVNTLRAGLPRTDASDTTDEDSETPTTEPEMMAPVALSYDRYAAALRHKHFDLVSYSFMTRDPDGNRFEAAALPPVDATARMADVQLIGPLAKASGLGQATRLSAAIMRTTGLDIRGVDFDLDNPAPEGFSSDTMIEEYGPAKINMIHLNAESTPLAFAYQPDVFSGTYNIGYFFWELDKPAYCHYLGMDMLDEIWVSTEYGVEIYQKDANGKPVVNVGMCYEETPDITREDSRDFVERRFQFNDSHFVCLVAFDSFSFVQRKNPVSVLRAFQQAFQGVPNARLIVKTQNRDSVFDSVQVNLWDQVDTIITSDPRIIVMNETLSYRDLLRLKRGSDVYVSLHKSEGWGFGMIEAMNLGVPVVCTAYSGNMDFCSDATAWMVDYEETLLRQEDYIFVRKGSVWAEPSVDHAAQQLRAAYDNPDQRVAKAQAAQDYIKANFSVEAIGERYGARLREILKGL